LKLFELDVPIRDAAAQLGVSYATALKARDVVQRAILAQAVDAREYYALGLGSGTAGGRDEPPTPVFGVMDLDGYILCDLLPDVTPETLLHFKGSFYLRTASLGQVVYTAPWRKYRMLTACGPRLWPSRAVRHDDAGIPADNGGFWPYAKERLRRLRGVSPARFPLYLKEWELRYNRREGDLLPVLAAAVCSLVPDEAGLRGADDRAGRARGPEG
ncbi:MAG: DDE transposase, partial [Desulfovibrionaceae bacterium]